MRPVCLSNPRVQMLYHCLRAAVVCRGVWLPANKWGNAEDARQVIKDGLTIVVKLKRVAVLLRCCH